MFENEWVIELIIDIVLDAIIDNVKILPFLFLTFLLMEYIEDSMNDRMGNVLKKAGKTGPLWGALVGIVPQCGLSAAGANLYAGRVISIGTLLAIFLSNSDEMLPIMIADAINPYIILLILSAKILVAVIAGFSVDFIYKKILKKQVKEVDIHHFCEHEHCECGKGILRPALKHTIKIFAFLLVFSIALGFVIELVGLENIASSVLNNDFIGPIFAGIIGLIPNCAASVLLTKLFLEGVISGGTMLSGLLVGAGVGILVLIRVNEGKSENIRIVCMLYFIGVISGMVFNLFGFLSRVY